MVTMKWLPAVFLWMMAKTRYDTLLPWIWTAMVSSNLGEQCLSNHMKSIPSIAKTTGKNNGASFGVNSFVMVPWHGCSTKFGPAGSWLLHADVVFVFNAQFTASVRLRPLTIMFRTIRVLPYARDEYFRLSELLRHLSQAFFCNNGIENVLAMNSSCLAVGKRNLTTCCGTPEDWLYSIAVSDLHISDGLPKSPKRPLPFMNWYAIASRKACLDCRLILDICVEERGNQDNVHFLNMYWQTGDASVDEHNSSPARWRITVTTANIVLRKQALFPLSQSIMSFWGELVDNRGFLCNRATLTDCTALERERCLVARGATTSAVTGKWVFVGAEGQLWRVLEKEGARQFSSCWIFRRTDNSVWALSCVMRSISCMIAVLGLYRPIVSTKGSIRKSPKSLVTRENTTYCHPCAPYLYIEDHGPATK